MIVQALRLFVSSPGDVPDERRRIDLVIERLNTEFEGRVKIDVIRWETRYYSAHDTFQRQIPEASACDVVIALFRSRLGTPLPASFPASPSGDAYPSGTAYEVLTAIEARKASQNLPDIYVFRYPDPPSVTLDDPAETQIKEQWERLKTFFDRYFKTENHEFIAAFKYYKSTDDFAEQVEECLRQWLARKGFIAKGVVWDRVLSGSPFPGLSAFEANRGSVFFGRALAIAHSLERLRETGRSGKRLSFLLVIGASGSGKSSLLRAGLMPRLVMPGAIPEIDLWRSAVVVPGRDPFLSLADALFADGALGLELRQGTFRTRELLAKQLAGDVDTALAPLRDAIGKAAECRRSEAHFETSRATRLALAIDQAERLLVEADAKLAMGFAALLEALTRQNLAYVMMALRSDAYAHFQKIESLVRLREAGASFDLLPPSTAELEEIVRRPVSACYPPLVFEEHDGHSLADLLVSDLKGGDALPLLQMTLARLYSAEAGRGDGVLHFADYCGMDAAVTATANEALDQLSAEVRAELPTLVAGLVADVAADPLTGASIPIVTALDRAAFEARKPARGALVEAFVDMRLLTAEGDGVAQLVRPTHEALLRIWPQAVTIIAEIASLIRVRHTLEPMVREWNNAGQSEKSNYLKISPALLDGAQRVIARFGEDLPARMKEFINQAILEDTRQRCRERRRQRNILVATFCALAVVTVFAAAFAWQWHQTAQQRQRAEKSLQTATETANQMTSRFAEDLKNRSGMPIDLVHTILDGVRDLHQKLLTSGENSPELRLSEAKALNELILTDLEQESRAASSDVTSALNAAESFKQIMGDLVATDPHNNEWQRWLSFSLNREGDILALAGRHQEALSNFQKSVDLRKGLITQMPGDLQAQSDLAAAFEKVGEQQAILFPDDQRAYDSFFVAFEIRKSLVSATSDETRWRDLGMSYERIGHLVQSFGQFEEALSNLEESQKIRIKMVHDHPENTMYRRDLGDIYDLIGSDLKDSGRMEEALAKYEESLKERLALASADPGNMQRQRELGISYNNIGDLMLKLHRNEEARMAYTTAMSIQEQLIKADPSSVDFQIGLIFVLRGLALCDDNPRERLSVALQIARRLDGEGKLFANNKNVVPELEKMLTK